LHLSSVSICLQDSLNVLDFRVLEGRIHVRSKLQWNLVAATAAGYFPHLPHLQNLDRKNFSFSQHWGLSWLEIAPGRRFFIGVAIRGWFPENPGLSPTRVVKTGRCPIGRVHTSIVDLSYSNRFVDQVDIATPALCLMHLPCLVGTDHLVISVGSCHF